MEHFNAAISDGKPIARRQRGFSLIELMIVLAVVAILLTVALPAYQDQIRRTKRTDGQAFLMDVAAAQERFFTQNVDYSANMAGLGFGGSTSPEGHNTIAIVRTNCTGGRCTGFTLTATPTFTDGDCTTLTLTHTNQRGATGADTSRCWN